MFTTEIEHKFLEMKMFTAIVTTIKTRKAVANNIATKRDGVSIGGPGI